MPIEHDVPYDAIIVGGGPAGLTCAIFLGRYRRRVLVIDNARPRNYASRGVHGFLGQHGILPGELLARGRAEATESGVEMCDTSVDRIEQVGDVFEVHTANERDVLRTRRVVLAYGVRDTLPDIPEIESYYGISLHHCPDCDGYECSDKRIGIIGWNKGSVAVAFKLQQWSDEIVVFTHGHEREWDNEENSKLLAQSIGVKDERIVALVGEEGRVKAAVLDTGERVSIEALFFNIHVERSCDLAEQLGCEIENDTDVKVNDVRETTIEGVYAVGDLVKGSKLAITSAADGAIAAIAINKSLLPPSRQV
jgi:thioredoxin reductase